MSVRIATGLPEENVSGLSRTIEVLIHPQNGPPPKMKKKKSETRHPAPEGGDNLRRAVLTASLLGLHPRPSWEEYFMDITHLVAKRSTCVRRHVGALLVKDKKILATGYNGAPARLEHCLGNRLPS